MKSILAFTVLGLGAAVSAGDDYRSHNLPPHAAKPHLATPHVKAPKPTPKSDAFILWAQGPASAHGSIGQIKQGQNRIGGALNRGEYTLKDGHVFDKHHRGCLLSEPTSQWQCDEGKAGDDGFDIDCHGKLTHKGSSAFFACPVNDDGEWNLYKSALPRQNKCVEITLAVQGHALPAKCQLNHASKVQKARQAPYKVTPSVVWPLQEGPSHSHSDTTLHIATVPTTTTHHHIHTMLPLSPTPLPTSHHNAEFHKAGPAKCPFDLNGEFEFPHLMVRVDQSQPTTPLGTQWNGTVAPGVCTIFNFDIHSDHRHKQCAFMFMIPELSELQSSTYSLSGAGNLFFYAIDEPANELTTWEDKPKGHPLNVGPRPLKPGENILIDQVACPAGTRIGVQMCSDGNLEFDYFQDYAPPPIGLYVRVCDLQL